MLTICYYRPLTRKLKSWSASCGVCLSSSRNRRREVSLPDHVPVLYGLDYKWLSGIRPCTNNQTVVVFSIQRTSSCAIKVFSRSSFALLVLLRGTPRQSMLEMRPPFMLTALLWRTLVSSLSACLTTHPDYAAVRVHRHDASWPFQAPPLTTHPFRRHRPSPPALYSHRPHSANPTHHSRPARFSVPSRLRKTPPHSPQQPSRP